MKTLYAIVGSGSNWIPNEKTFGNGVFSLGIYYVVINFKITGGL